MDEISANVYCVINLSIALGIAFQTSLRLSSASINNKFIRYTTGVLCLQIVYCILFINSRAKQANGIMNGTLVMIEDIAPLLFCFIFATICWLLLLRARAMFPNNAAEWRIGFPVGVTVIGVLFLLRLIRVCIRFVATATSKSDPELSKTLVTVAVQLNNIAIVPVNLFQCLMDGLFLYQFVFKLRGERSIFRLKLTKKSSLMFNSIMAEFAIAILNCVLAIISFFTVANNLFNFVTAILASVQINNLVEFGTDVREYMDDLRESALASGGGTEFKSQNKSHLSSAPSNTPSSQRAIMYDDIHPNPEPESHMMYSREIPAYAHVQSPQSPYYPSPALSQGAYSSSNYGK